MVIASFDALCGPLLLAQTTAPASPFAGGPNPTWSFLPPLVSAVISLGLLLVAVLSARAARKAAEAAQRSAGAATRRSIFYLGNGVRRTFAGSFPGPRDATTVEVEIVNTGRDLLVLGRPLGDCQCEPNGAFSVADWAAEVSLPSIGARSFAADLVPLPAGAIAKLRMTIVFASVPVDTKRCSGRLSLSIRPIPDDGQAALEIPCAFEVTT